MNKRVVLRFGVSMLLSITGCGGLALTIVKVPRPPETCTVNPAFVKLGVTTIAVLPFEDSSKAPAGEYLTADGSSRPTLVHVADAGKYVAGLVETELTASYKYRVVEREKVAALVEELAFQGTDLVDVQSAAQWGGMLGADALVVGKVVHLNAALVATKSSAGEGVSTYVDNAAFTVKVVHVATGEVLAVCEKIATTANFLDADFVFSTQTPHAEWEAARTAKGGVARILVREFVATLPGR